MSNKTYFLNKGVNQSIEFRGLRAQYVLYLAIGLAGLLVMFAILYIAGLPSYCCIGVLFAGGGGLFHFVYKMSKRYGQHGLMKKMAARRVPGVLVSRTRRVFMLPGKRVNL